MTICDNSCHKEVRKVKEHEPLHIIVGILQDHGMTLEEAILLVGRMIEEEGPAIVEGMKAEAGEASAES